MLAADYPRPDGLTPREYFGRVTEWLVRCFKGMGEDTARAHVSAAMTRSVPNGDRPWNSKSSTPFPIFVGRVALNMERNTRRTAARRGNVSLLDGHDQAPDSTPSAEEALLIKERRERIAAALRKDLEDSPTVLPWLERVLGGETPDEEAYEEMGLTHAQVLKARARVKVFLDRWNAKHGSTVDSGPWEASA